MEYRLFGFSKPRAVGLEFLDNYLGVPIQVTRLHWEITLHEIDHLE